MAQSGFTTEEKASRGGAGEKQGVCFLPSSWAHRLGTLGSEEGRELGEWGGPGLRAVGPLEDGVCLPRDQTGVLEARV